MVRLINVTVLEVGGVSLKILGQWYVSVFMEEIPAAVTLFQSDGSCII